jgi:uncharacterized coiled-coil protein SlyX
MKNPTKHPVPKSTLPLIAPNEQAEVQKTIDEHPEIDTMDEEARGEIIDITARRINPAHGEKPWGRKARNNDPNNPNLNTDGMTFLRPDGLFEIYDCISGIDGQSTWDGYGPFAQGENGYWWPPNPVEDTGDGGSVIDDSELAARVAALEEVVEAQEVAIEALQQTVHAHTEQIAALDQRLAALEASAGGPYHCHGPVDLPIVMESLTSLRARGDINVAVTPGEAEPPPPPSDDGVSLGDLALVKWLRGRDDDEAPTADTRREPRR